MDGGISKETWRIHWENKFLSAMGYLFLALFFLWDRLIVPIEGDSWWPLGFGAVALVLVFFVRRRSKRIWPYLEDELEAF